jgi:lipid A 3-O-deacylase|tara:strand:+ start:1518 stop:2027 length:510 start_codon:yes stop_codon:yes gene_type:complete
MTKKLKITIYFIFSFLLISPSTSDENLNDNEINFYSGMFDFSDDGQRALLFGLQHQNENLIRESVLGEISPVTGFFLTENQAAYLYTGIQAHYNLGDLDFTPSFTPGLYHEGDGKDLGHVIEFKTEVQFSINTSADTKFGFSYNHVSNASLGSKNPGANSYIFNFFKKF